MPAHRTTLLATPVVQVSSCPCGQVHVELGHTTLRLDEAAFSHVAAALARAEVELRRRAHARSAREDA